MRPPSLRARLAVHLLQSEHQPAYHTLPVRTSTDNYHRSAKKNDQHHPLLEPSTWLSAWVLLLMEDVEMNDKMANFYSYHQDRFQDRSIYHCYRLCHKCCFESM